MDFGFNAVIVDTSALESCQFDFCGLTSQTIPAFYELLAENKIELLNHPVLDGEIKKHIAHSQLIEKAKGLRQTFQRSRGIFQLIGISPEESIKRLDELDIYAILLKKYAEILSSATMLPFSNPEKIFESYFMSYPPFSESGDKKREFPDAFIIESIKDYLQTHTLSNILVVSSDDDWKKAFETVNCVSFCSSIDEALKLIHNTKRIEHIVAASRMDILSEIASYAEYEYFNLPEYELANGADVELSSIEATDIDNIVPLEMSLSSVLFKCTAHLTVTGSTRVVDEDRSYYDREDRRYYYISYSDISFRNGSTEIECEIKINCSPNSKNADIESIAILAKYGIDIDMDGAEITVDYCSDDDLALEALREDLGRQQRFRHN